MTFKLLMGKKNLYRYRDILQELQALKKKGNFFNRDHSSKNVFS